ncbi:acyl dehydratase [Citricoccus sp. SGAir0253]|uniref:MaoC family dehydratase n=1 Tax=Citricoccus sp. SGAir0253 TaxID=2567881 RepID=UPI00110778B9|nr:MaoC family dehydratase [Citricoccus sp. SGAir0253]QCU77426.1 acyl dehydratase [Citricoccus sp. SGAir0253]
MPATPAKGESIGTATVHLERADLVRYAGASGDFNPIHWSESMARAVGLPGVIAHGMLTMGTAVQLVTDWCGDPGAVVDYQTRFTQMVPVPEDGGADLEVSGKVGAVNDDGTVRIDLAVTTGGTKVLTKAQALVRLGER